MARLVVEDGRLHLTLSPLERLGAFHGDLTFPASAVTNLHTTERGFDELRGLRAPGTGLPRVVALGTFRYRGGKDFAALYGSGPAVVVDLAGQPFTRLLVSTPDADSEMRSLGRKIWGRGAHQT